MRKPQDAGVGGELRDDEDLPIDLERERMDQGALGRDVGMTQGGKSFLLLIEECL